MKKKLAALVLAVTMVMGTGLTVCAETISDMAGAAEGQTITGDATLNLPTIKVTVPTTADIVINPFQMVYTDSEDNKSSDQIICVPQDIVNESNVAVAVNVADLTAKDVSDGILISTTALTDKITTKSAFLYLEVVEDGAEFAAYNSKNANQVVIPYVTEGERQSREPRTQWWYWEQNRMMALQPRHSLPFVVPWLPIPQS